MGPLDLRLLPALLFALVVPAASVASLQALIDATPAGGTLKLAAGSCGDGLITQTLRQHEDPQPRGEDQAWLLGMTREILGSGAAGG